ncbi:hypothetical protein TL16_g10099 [Triparma laevis f. inornata]|uniref:Cyclic nucleotide-binding domain-containing protein n=2 Tax=Triparma laevis TaxID=1534972 RepID=A0A9W7F9Z1_9STRA|nr:hypothetical protein TL16_g10099 [Triparma laevis f. inornata]GMI08201.1 hypothetical protein TrLO_g371 [Triparma laevis f. longispina]
MVAVRPTLAPSPGLVGNPNSELGAAAKSRLRDTTSHGPPSLSPKSPTRVLSSSLTSPKRSPHSPIPTVTECSSKPERSAKREPKIGTQLGVGNSPPQSSGKERSIMREGGAQHSGEVGSNVRRHSASGPILSEWATQKPKPGIFDRFLGKYDKEANIKILHDDVEKQILQTVRRNSMKKDGLSETDIEKALKMADKAEKSNYLIHPDSRYRLWWDMITAIFVLYLIWLVPFSIGFDAWYPNSTMKGFNNLIDVWFAFDVALNFRTGFVDHGVMVMDQRKIAKNYLRTYFIVDFIASVPWEYFTNNSSTDRKSLKLIKYFKLPKLMRISRMIRFFNKYTRFYGLTLSIMSMFVLVHFEGTLTAGVLADVCVENDNIYLSGVNNTYYIDTDAVMCAGPYDDHTKCMPHLCATNKVMELYAESLYVSMSFMIGSPLSGYVGGELSELGCFSNYMSAFNATMISDGEFRDAGNNVLAMTEDVVCPSNLVKILSQYNHDNWHFILTSFFMLVGVAQIAVLFGHLGLLLQSKYQASAAFRMKLDRVKAECEYYKVPWDLQNRVFAYYDYLWVNQKQYDDKILLMNDRGMSSDLRGKLALFLYKDVIQGVTLFERVDDTFLSKICMELQTRVYLPQDWVILKGDIGSELYIISRGVVQVFIVDPGEEEDEFEEELRHFKGNKDELAKKEQQIAHKRKVKAEKESIYLHRGNFFGEVSLLMETRRTTSVQAKTICELNVLVQEVFEEILRESPEFAEEMKHLVMERAMHNAQRAPGEDDERDGLAEHIEAQVTDAIESRQLLANRY